MTTTRCECGPRTNLTSGSNWALHLHFMPLLGLYRWRREMNLTAAYMIGALIFTSIILIASARAQTPQTYTNTKYGFTIKYPSVSDEIN